MCLWMFHMAKKIENIGETVNSFSATLWKCYKNRIMQKQLETIYKHVVNEAWKLGNKFI